jgi:hypothetical protein
MTAVLTADRPKLQRGRQITEQRNDITDARPHLMPGAVQSSNFRIETQSQ